jgi:hypothetical protein
VFHCCLCKFFVTVLLCSELAIGHVVHHAQP